MIEMARTRPENEQRQYPQSCPKTDTTGKKEARMTKDKTAEDGNDGAKRDGTLMGRGGAQHAAKDRTLWRIIVVALCPTGDEDNKSGRLQTTDRERSMDINTGEICGLSSLLLRKTGSRRVCGYSGVDSNNSIRTSSMKNRTKA